MFKHGPEAVLKCKINAFLMYVIHVNLNPRECTVYMCNKQSFLINYKVKII